MWRTLKFSKVKHVGNLSQKCEYIYISKYIYQFLKPKISLLYLFSMNTKSQLGLYNKESLNFKRKKYINCDLWKFWATFFIWCAQFIYSVLLLYITFHIFVLCFIPFNRLIFAEKPIINYFMVGLIVTTRSNVGSPWVLHLLLS